jgi:hypothetical protein
MSGLTSAANRVDWISWLCSEPKLTLRRWLARGEDGGPDRSQTGAQGSDYPRKVAKGLSIRARAGRKSLRRQPLLRGVRKVVPAELVDVRNSSNSYDSSGIGRRTETRCKNI